MAFQCEKKFFSNLRDLSLMNGSQLIWKILHFNGLKSSNLKDSVDPNLNPQSISFIYHTKKMRNLVLKNQQMIRIT